MCIRWGAPFAIDRGGALTARTLGVCQIVCRAQRPLPGVGVKQVGEVLGVTVPVACQDVEDHQAEGGQQVQVVAGEDARGLEQVRVVAAGHPEVGVYQVAEGVGVEAEIFGGAVETQHPDESVNLGSLEQAGLPVFRDPGASVAMVPGRGDRLLQRPATELEPFGDELIGALAPHLDRPYILYGHSNGSFLAYALCRRIEERAPGHRSVWSWPSAGRLTWSSGPGSRPRTPDSHGCSQCSTRTARCGRTASCSA